MIKQICLIFLITYSAPSYAVYKGSNKAHGELISTNVGKVLDRIVTSREVIINDFIEQALYKKKKKKTVRGLSLSNKRFSRETTAVLLEWAVFFEAQNFNSSTVSSAKLANAKKKASYKLSHLKNWQKQQVSTKEFNEVIRRKIQAKEFITFKINSSSVPITDGEALEYFNENRIKFGDLPFKNFKKNIKTFLRRQQVDRRLKDWFEVLQSKYNVRNYLNET